MPYYKGKNQTSIEPIPLTLKTPNYKATEVSRKTLFSSDLFERIDDMLLLQQ